MSHVNPIDAATGRPSDAEIGSVLTDDRPPAAPSLLARLLLALIAVYRWTATIRQPRCRFHPTCSAYAAESIRVHGALRGSGYAVRRIGRCHPWNPGGVDHVPPPRK